MLPPIKLNAYSNVKIQETESRLFSLLTCEHEAELLQLRLRNFQSVEPLECLVSRSDLKHFIQWALQQSYSSTLTSAEKMQLLDIAWKVQRLLWVED